MAWICPICKKEKGKATVRESWIQAGGRGKVPPEDITFRLSHHMDIRR